MFRFISWKKLFCNVLFLYLNYIFVCGCNCFFLWISEHLITADLLQKIAFSLFKSRLALGSPGCSVGCSSPCRKWPNTQENGYWLPPSDHIHSWPDQERGIISQASLLHSWHWVLFFQCLEKLFCDILIFLRSMLLLWKEVFLQITQFSQAMHAK